MAAFYTLDICSGDGGICGPLPERMAPGMVKEPADFFDDFFVVRFFGVDLVVVVMLLAAGCLIAGLTRAVGGN